MRAWAIALIVLVGLAASTPPRAFAADADASRDAAAEQFVQVQGQRLVSILADKSGSADDRVRAFGAGVGQIADVPRIARFVLGKYGRTITPAQMQRYAPAFAAYAQTVYRQKLANFRGDTLTVTGSVVSKPGDVVVKTTIGGGDADQPTPVLWRVMGSGASWKVVDVQVSGVWLAITQQADFVSTLDNAGGDIDVLIARLQAVTQGQTAPAAADQ